MLPVETLLLVFHMMQNDDLKKTKIPGGYLQITLVLLVIRFSHTVIKKGCKFLMFLITTVKCISITQTTGCLPPSLASPGTDFQNVHPELDCFQRSL